MKARKYDIIKLQISYFYVLKIYRNNFFDNDRSSNLDKYRLKHENCNSYCS